MERLPSLWVDKAMIRLLLSDIDGTLIQYDPKIHKTDVDAIHQLQEHGVQFGLVTGRDIGFCRHLLTHHNLQADCIVANMEALYGFKNIRCLNIIWMVKKSLLL